MPKLACLLLRSTDEVGGGRAVGPAALYLLYPRCVRVPSGVSGTAGACAFFFDFFFEDLHFRSDLEEEDEAGGGLPSSALAPEPQASCSKGGADGRGGGGAAGNPRRAVVANFKGPQHAQHRASCQLWVLPGPIHPNKWAIVLPTLVKRSTTAHRLPSVRSIVRMKFSMKERPLPMSDRRLPLRKASTPWRAFSDVDWKARVCAEDAAEAGGDASSGARRAAGGVPTRRDHSLRYCSWSPSISSSE
jgi:hypothetical protein